MLDIQDSCVMCKFYWVLRSVVYMYVGSKQNLVLWAAIYVLMIYFLNIKICGYRLAHCSSDSILLISGFNRRLLLVVNKHQDQCCTVCKEQ